MTEKIRILLSELKSGLQETYGDRLKNVYLYGSHARGEEDSESDVDVLVVLDDYDSYGAEVDRTGVLGAGLSLKYGLSISKVFIRERDWKYMQTPFLLNTREEAVHL